jgi:hypothetical protein
LRRAAGGVYNPDSIGGIDAREEPMTRLMVACLLPALMSPTVPARAQEPARKLVPPVRGEAQIEMTKPETKVEGNEVVTRFRVRNVSKGAIAGFRVDETWYDKAGNALPGDSFRFKRPLEPGEVIDVELRVPKNPNFRSNIFQFTHAYGKFGKPTIVKSLPPPEKKG